MAALTLKQQFEGFSIPSTYERIEALCYTLKQAQIKAINELKCLHRDPESSEIHVDHPSSTGLYQKRPIDDILPRDGNE